METIHLRLSPNSTRTRERRYIYLVLQNVSQWAVTSLMCSSASVFNHRAQWCGFHNSRCSIRYEYSAINDTILSQPHTGDSAVALMSALLVLERQDSNISETKCAL